MPLSKLIVRNHPLQSSSQIASIIESISSSLIAHPNEPNYVVIIESSQINCSRAYFCPCRLSVHSPESSIAAVWVNQTPKWVYFVIVALSPHLESSIAVVSEQANYAVVTVSTVYEPNPISTLPSNGFISQNRRNSSLLLSRPIAYPDEPNRSQRVSPIASISGVFE